MNSFKYGSSNCLTFRIFDDFNVSECMEPPIHTYTHTHTFPLPQRQHHNNNLRLLIPNSLSQIELLTERKMDYIRTQKQKKDGQPNGFGRELHHFDSLSNCATEAVEYNVADSLGWRFLPNESYCWAKNKTFFVGNKLSKLLPTIYFTV